jgi:hypothetical protein
MSEDCTLFFPVDVRKSQRIHSDSLMFATVTGAQQLRRARHSPCDRLEGSEQKVQWCWMAEQGVHQAQTGGWFRNYQPESSPHWAWSIDAPMRCGVSVPAHTFLVRLVSRGQCCHDYYHRLARIGHGRGRRW